MIEDNFRDGLPRPRPVLGDITNLPAKRAFSLISDDAGLKSGDGHGKILGSEGGDLQFAEQIYVTVPKWSKENCKTQSGVVSGEKHSHRSSPIFSNENEVSRENVACVDANKLDDTVVDKSKPDETKEKSNLLDVDNATGLRNTAMADGLRHNLSMSASSQHCVEESEDEGTFIINAKQSCKATNEGLGSHICGNDDKDLAIGRLVSSQGGSSEWLRLPKSQCSRSFEFRRCAGLKSDECVNLNGDIDLLKACSCSFCLKVGYIWSDLHYQDIKGRLAVLKKSQKEANILAQKCGKEKNNDIHGQGNPNKSSKLEADLTNQWKSLFLNMEDTFVHESSQLQAGCVTLKDLRESCKMDLERASGMSSDKK